MPLVFFKVEFEDLKQKVALVLLMYGYLPAKLLHCNVENKAPRVFFVKFSELSVVGLKLFLLVLEELLKHALLGKEHFLGRIHVLV